MSERVREDPASYAVLEVVEKLQRGSDSSGPLLNQILGFLEHRTTPPWEANAISYWAGAVIACVDAGDLDRDFRGHHTVTPKGWSEVLEHGDEPFPFGEE